MSAIQDVADLAQRCDADRRHLRSVAFQLLDGPFVIDEPYDHQHSYRYLLRFSSDPFLESEGPPEGIHGPYYDPSYLDYYGWKRE